MSTVTGELRPLVVRPPHKPLEPLPCKKVYQNRAVRGRCWGDQAVGERSTQCLEDELAEFAGESLETSRDV